MLLVPAIACGPTLSAAEESTEFLDVAEESVDGFCTRSEVCRNEAADRGHLLIDPYDGRCHEALLDSTERIYDGDRCTDPDTMLGLYDCIASLECSMLASQREDCSHEYAAVEAALCYPF